MTDEKETPEDMADRIVAEDDWAALVMLVASHHEEITKLRDEVAKLTEDKRRLWTP